MTSHRPIVATAFALTAFVTICADVAAAQHAGADKLDSIVRDRASRLTGRTRVIVEFTGAVDVRVLGAGAQRRIGERLQVADVENRAIADLAADPRVRRVMFDRVAFPTLERTGASIGATLVREQLGLTGKGVGIAVIDSGVTSWHDDLYLPQGRLSDRVAHVRDFTRDLSSQLWMNEIPSDEYGHGTHVAGIIAGSGFASRGRRVGVAPGAHLVGLKVLDAGGHGYISDVIAAIDYAIAIRSTYNIRIINLSIASGVFESYQADPLTQAARRAVDAGIVVVAAAGNVGRNAEGESQFGGITSPGNAPWVLTVGASSHQGTAPRHDDTIGGFSSRGPTWIDFAAKPDLVAPGVGIESLSDRGSTLYGSLADYLLDGVRGAADKPYLSMSGTSMAAPVVAGTVALMLEANPRLTPNAVKAILQFTAEARPAEHTLTQGAGLLNARGAVRMARFFAAPQQGLGEMQDTIEGETIPWAQHIVWGNYLVAGGVPLPGSTAWAVGLPWGAVKTQDGTPVVWGAANAENIVCGGRNCARVVWGTRSGDTVWGALTADDNIVWSTFDSENIVWSTYRDENIVWSTDAAGNVWATYADDNIVWSTFDSENIVWSTYSDENIVWSTGFADQVLWPQPVRSVDRIR